METLCRVEDRIGNGRAGGGADRMGGPDRARGELNGNPMQEVNFIHHFVDLVPNRFLCYVLISAQYLCQLIEMLV